jgi:hypothetical protein
VLAIGYDGATVRTYVDGDVAHIYSTTASIPTGVAMGLFIGHINGNGAGGNGVFVDYIRSVSER